MTRYFGAGTIVLLIGMVLTRVMVMKRHGIEAMHIGKIDKSDFAILPFVLFYFYLIFATAFRLPSISRQTFFQSEVLASFGVVLCLAGLLLMAWSMAYFGSSFRVGIDTEQPDALVTSGIFACIRNPIYAAFGLILIGQFLIFSNWILLVYMVLGFWLFHRQVLREEEYLREHYGREFTDYCQRVRRYL